MRVSSCYTCKKGIESKERTREGNRREGKTEMEGR